MTNLFASRKTITAAFLMAVGLIAISNSTAQANTATKLSQCRAFTKEKVVKCCEHIIHLEKKPIWFTENNLSCNTAVVCTGRKQQQPAALAQEVAPVAQALVLNPKPRGGCYFEMPNDSNQGKPQIVTKLRGR